MVSFPALSDLVAFILNLSLGVYAYWRGRRQVVSTAFCALAITIALWELSEAKLLITRDPQDAFLWIKLTYTALFLLSSALVSFSLIFLSDSIHFRYRTFFWFLPYLPASLLIGLLLLTDLLLSRVQPQPGYGQVEGPLYWIFRLYLSFYFFIAIGVLLWCVRKADSPIRRTQCRYLLIGFLFPVISGVVIVNILWPLGIHSLDVGVAPLATIPMTGIFAYAIVRYRLMGIEVILTRGIAYALSLILSVGPLLAMAVWMQKQVFGVISYPYTLYTFLALTVAGLVFSRLASWMRENVTPSLWKRGRNYQDIVNNFSKSVIHSSTLLPRQGIAQSLGQVLTESFAPTTVYLLEEEKGSRSYQTVASHDRKRTVTEDDPLILWLREHNGIVVRAELELEREEERKASLIPTLKGMACEVCVPIKITGRLIGFIAVGDQYGKKAYTLEDFHFLSLLTNETAIALENARLYEELKKSQELLARSDRLAAVGTLAASIAHEIRNPLVSIHTLTQLLPERLDDPEFRTTFLQLASREVARVCDLINDLMTFARPSPPVIREVDLNAVLEPIVRLLGGQAKKKGVSLTFSLSPRLPPVLADEGPAKQVFMNLVLNAVQATPAGGEVIITTQTLRGQGGKEYCRVEVRDTGDGIPPECKERIFDPFFTTKDSGAGLGLFIAHQIVAEHGGYIDVESVVGKGASFYVYLPCVQEQEVETTRFAPDRRRIENIHRLTTGTGKR